MHHLNAMEVSNLIHVAGFEVSCIAVIFTRTYWQFNDIMVTCQKKNAAFQQEMMARRSRPFVGFFMHLTVFRAVF